MPRNISFALTTQQFLAGEKTVTRRDGWVHVKVGDVLNAVYKSQGLKKGEKVRHLGQIKVTSARRERLDAITQEDVIKEGFPDLTPALFVKFFCEHNQCKPWDVVTVIEFERIKEAKVA